MVTFLNKRTIFVALLGIKIIPPKFGKRSAAKIFKYIDATHTNKETYFLMQNEMSFFRTVTLTLMSLDSVENR